MKAQLPTERAAWKALEVHCTAIRNLHLRQFFADDPRRGERVTAEATRIYLDYSKNCEGNLPTNTILAQRLTPETLGLLVALRYRRLRQASE